jgi:peptidoglycan/LPS O-acetylase OafA/YrhL
MIVARHHNNFDLLRLLAASFVFISHSYAIRGIADQEFLIRISSGRYSLSGLGLTIFFTISGFLVSKSIDQTPSVKSFLFKRFLRIWPGLMVNILLTIMITGLFFTVLTFSSFLSDSQTIKYLLVNISLVKAVLWLPGAFGSRPVNISLWTIPVETRLYLLLLIGWLAGLFKKKIFMIILWSAAILFFIDLHAGGYLISIIPKPLIWDSGLFMFFLTGSLAYFFREYLKFNAFIWMGMLACRLLAFKWLPQYSSILDFPFFSYTILFFGYGIMTFPFIKSDLSYGIYLYGFPVQIAVQSVFGNTLNTVQNLFIAIFITLILATASWNLIEKRALLLKSRYK